MTRHHDDEHAHVDQAATELLHLWPAFEHALEADQAGGDGRGGGNPFRLPVNGEVLDTVRLLAVDVPHQNRIARQVLGHHSRFTQRLTMTDDLAAISSLHLELTQREHDTAGHYAEIVYGWERHARRAIGLTREPSTIGQTCPWHRDQPTELMLRGAEAEIRYRHVGNDDREQVTWRQPDTIFCPLCGRAWVKALWWSLGKQIKQADRADARDREDEGSESG